MDVAKSYSIAYKALSDGTHHYEFDVDGSLFAYFENTEIKNCGCKAIIELDRHSTQLRLDVKIEGWVVVECDRCLDDCQLPVDYDGELIVKFSDEVSDYDGEVMWVSPSASEVDLAQYIYESILLSLPYQRVHKAGECNADMMSRFEVVSGEEFEQIEQRLAAEAAKEEGDSPWAKLAELKDKLEK